MVNLSRALRISLQHCGNVIKEIRSTELTQEIQIGRSSSCAWQTPTEDLAVGKLHAILAPRGRKIVLVDKGSTNGTWFQDKRIQERELRAGDRITISHCVVVVEEEANQNHAKTVPEVMLLTGKQRNQRLSIQAGSFSIGSDPTSDLLLLDDLVSRRHAVILRKEDDSCWLKDLKSTNGTKVNDEPLRAEQERLLKDGDRITVAHVEFVFHDGTERRDQGQALRKLAALVVVTLLAAGAYLGWQSLRKSAGGCIQEARRLKEKGNFGEARLKLDSAINRRGYREEQDQAEILRSQINRCESAFQDWQAIQGHLKNHDWTNAYSQLSRLVSLEKNMDAWEWPKGQEVKLRALKIKGWLDAFMDTSYAERLSLGLLQEKEKRLATAIQELRAEKDLEALEQEASARAEKLRGILVAQGRLDNALQKLSRGDIMPDPYPVLREIQLIQSNTTGTASEVVQAAQRLQPVLEEFAAGYKQFTNALFQAREMRFREISELNLALPRPDDCAINTNLIQFRTNLENRWAHLKLDVSSAAGLAQPLINRLGTVEAVPTEMQYWTTPAILKEVFACDSLGKPFPRRSRTAPQGEYDQAVNIEWFYLSLRALADPRPMDVDKSALGSRLEAAMETISAAKSLLDFVKNPNHEWLQKSGQMAQWVHAAGRMFELRDRIVEEMREKARQSSGREALIALGIAWHLMANEDRPFRELVTKQFKEVHQAVMALDEKRTTASLADRIELRKSILKVGLPGDPFVNQMWIESADSGNSGGGR